MAIEVKPETIICTIAVKMTPAEARELHQQLRDLCLEASTRSPGPLTGLPIGKPRVAELMAGLSEADGVYGQV